MVAGRRGIHGKEVYYRSGPERGPSEQTVGNKESIWVVTDAMSGQWKCGLEDEE